jgi:hypothetical protein
MKHEIKVTGPFFCPPPDIWYVTRKLDPEERMAKNRRTLRERVRCYARILKFRGRRCYIIMDEHPSPKFTSLRKAVEYVTNCIVPTQDNS